MDTPEHYTSMLHIYSQTPINDTVMNIFINTNAVYDTHNSNVTRISLQFEYIYEHYAQAHFTTVINE